MVAGEVQSPPNGQVTPSELQFISTFMQEWNYIPTSEDLGGKKSVKTFTCLSQELAPGSIASYISNSNNYLKCFRRMPILNALYVSVTN